MNGTQVKARAVLLDVARRLEALAPASVRPALAADLEAARRRLGQATFRLAVLGEYKRGKSTLINALIGSPVLPTAVIPLTSVVTEVAYGEAPSVIVELGSGESRAVPPEALGEYVTEPGNPHNIKGVRRALLRHPAAWLGEGVRIVDTPGVGAVHEHNTELTYGFLDAVDVALFVFAADQPPGAEELRLLEAARGVTPRLLFVLNRADLLTAGELESALAFVRAQLAAVPGLGDAPVHALSARDALESRCRGGEVSASFRAFERQLHRVLVEEKSAILMTRAGTALRRALHLLALALQSELRAAALGAAELDRAVRTFEGGAAGIRHQHEQAVLLLRHACTLLHQRDLRAAEDVAARRMHVAVWPHVERALDAARSRALPATVRSLAEEIGDRVVEEMLDYYPESETFVRARLESAVQDFERKLGAAIEALVALAGRVLAMEVPIPTEGAAFEEPPRFYLRNWDFASGPLPRRAALALRLPGRWARRFAREQLAALLERRIRQNLAAIRSDWGRRLAEIARRVEAHGQGQVEATSRLVTEALARAHQRLGEADEDRAASERRVAATLEELSHLRAALDSSAST